MRKLATALALVAMTAGSLVATEGASFAAVRHGKRPVIQKIVSRRGKKGRKVSQKTRRHRKTRKAQQNPGMGPVSGGSESSMTG